MELFEIIQDVKVYYILIELPIELQRKVVRLKSNFQKWVGYGDKLHSRPHISFFQFKLDAQNEHVLVKELERIISGWPQINSKTLGIKGFQKNGLISVAVEPESLRPLHAFMSSALQNLVKVAHLKMKQLKYPHVTIAHVPAEMDFDIAYGKFQVLEFQMDFEIKKITLLVESSSSDKKWNKVKDFYLKE